MAVIVTDDRTGNHCFSPYIILTPALFGIADVYGNYDIGFVVLSGLMLLSIPLLLKIKTKTSH